MTNSSEVNRRRIEDKVSIGTGAYQYIATTWVSETDFDRVQRELETARAEKHAWEDTANFHKQERDDARAEVARLNKYILDNEKLFAAPYWQGKYETLKTLIEAHNQRCLIKSADSDADY